MQARDVDSRCGEVNFRDYLEFWRQSDSALADRRAGAGAATKRLFDEVLT
jgi:hypothetical protein